jgi:integrase
MTTISQAHILSKMENPVKSSCVRETWKGIQRKLGAPRTQAKPLMIDQLKKVIDSIRPTMLGQRDIALLLLGWSAAMRRSELVAVKREDIEFVPEGMILTISKSKTDQNSNGYKIGIPATKNDWCPVAAMHFWLERAKIEKGPIFYRVGMKGKGVYQTNIKLRRSLGSRMVNLIVQRRMRDAGFDSRGYTAHSLRAGFISSAAAIEVPEYMIQMHTRHKSTKVMRSYIREAGLFKKNPLSILF